MEGCPSNPPPDPSNPPPTASADRGGSGSAAANGNGGGATLHQNRQPSPNPPPNPPPSKPASCLGSQGKVEGMEGLNQKSREGKKKEGDCTYGERFCSKPSIPSTAAPPNTGQLVLVDGQPGWRLPGALPKAATAHVTVVDPDGRSCCVERRRITEAAA